MVMRKMTRALIIKALGLLAEYAQNKEIRLEVCVYGGAAMLLAYGNREMTKDVDAIIRTKSSIQPIIQKVAEELDLHENWMNDDVRMYVGEREALNELCTAEPIHENLKITKPTASYLLAMKCRACRKPLPGYAGDYEDIEFLIKKMGIKSIEEIQGHIDRYFMNAPLSFETKLELENLLKRVNSNA